MWALHGLRFLSLPCSLRKYPLLQHRLCHRLQCGFVLCWLPGNPAQPLPGTFLTLFPSLQGHSSHFSPHSVQVLPFPEMPQPGWGLPSQSSPAALSVWKLAPKEETFLHRCSSSSTFKWVLTYRRRRLLPTIWFWPSLSPPVPQGQSSWEENEFAHFFCLWTCFLVALHNISSGKLLNVRVQHWLTLIYEIPQNFHCDSMSHVNVASLAVTRGSFICMFHCSFSVMVWGFLEAKHRTQSPSVLVLYKLLVRRVH